MLLVWCNSLSVLWNMFQSWIEKLSCRWKLFCLNPLKTWVKSFGWRNVIAFSILRLRANFWSVETAFSLYMLIQGMHDIDWGTLITSGLLYFWQIWLETSHWNLINNPGKKLMGKSKKSSKNGKDKTIFIPVPP